ncbi:hypothetical protein [Chiayiivirga flava]|uniref:AAA+ ATPase domain-containing protein n=1 Tax=Chiayiivirga flava TaxID=659595 RepID=A0A7W8G091_9GAMM|nr:hypothetical protein [Chiayiivirga flava]MBB5209257.1 hypothetical protein [Chiayiivirga flava]
MTRATLIGPSRDGDQFHYHWAARQCLQLLPGSNDLVAVTIEGVSANENPNYLADGEEVVDVGLYFGDEAFAHLRLLRYVQLKHSTRQAQEHWTASDLKKTIAGFAARFKRLADEHGIEAVRPKVQFACTTNRPLAQDVSEALYDLAQGVPPRHFSIAQRLVSYSKLDDASAAEFFALFQVEARTPDLWAQRNLLARDLSTYLADADADTPLQIKELVTRKASSEFESDRAIRRLDLLRAIKVDEDQLLPAPCSISAPTVLLSRAQEASLIAEMLAGGKILVIHADGGVGKSTLSLRLAAAVPAGSHAVVYDCYGDGLYRHALNYRHRPQDALVQIANELASRALCDPLIPTTRADAKQYLRAFMGRMNQAINLLRSGRPDACLCIIIDAADNAEIAAEELGDGSFVRDLIRASVPDGVHFVFTCRTHRIDLLRAPLDANLVALEPFTQEETAKHLRGIFDDATDVEVSEFHYLSSANPRVQALALKTRGTLQETLQALGPTPSTVERTIGELLERAVAAAKDKAARTESAQIELICRGLAVLRPLVPISILARMSGVPEGAVRTFALELERPLLLKGDGLHFLDEPTETWFRERFQPEADALAPFIDRLRPLAAESAYVASTLPQLLLSAGRIDELVCLALSDRDLPMNNPIERRDVELQRLLFALKSCLKNQRWLEAAKLALKAGGEVAAESRQVQILQQNTHLAGALLAADRLEELVARRTFSSSWTGSHHVYDAGLFCARAELAADAQNRLRMALAWLSAWARQPVDDEAAVDDDDRCEFVVAMLRLRGADAAAEFLRGWTALDLSLSAGRMVGSRLVDLGQYELIDQLAHAAGNNIYLVLGLAEAVAKVGRTLPPEPLRRTMRILGDRRVQLPPDTGWSAEYPTLSAVQAAVVQAARLDPAHDAFHAAILERYLPAELPHGFVERYGSGREPLLRAYAVEAALRGQPLVPADIAPERLREQVSPQGRRIRSQDGDHFLLAVGGMLPWFNLWAELALGRQPVDLETRIASAASSSEHAEARDYHARLQYRQIAAIEWSRILGLAPRVSGVALKGLVSWGEHKDRPLTSTTLTTMAYVVARTPGLEGQSLAWGAAAHALLESQAEDAQEQAEAYLNLARAVLPASSREAAAYFAKAFGIASCIGDENLDRWSALLSVARTAAERREPRPQSAYRLSRAAELTYKYIVRDKHFDWEGTVEAISDLCPASSLAILSRWRDRRFGRSDELLPIAVQRLVTKGSLPATTAVSLAGLRADWNRLEDLRCALRSLSDASSRRLHVNVAYRYMCVESHPRSTWEALSKTVQELGIALPDLDRLVVARGLTDTASRADDTQAPAETQLTCEVPWGLVFHDVVMLDPTSLRDAYDRFNEVDPLPRRTSFFAEAADRAGLGRLADLVDAVAAWPDLDTYDLACLVDALSSVLPQQLSLRTAVRQAALDVARRLPNRVRLDSWEGDSIFARLQSLQILSRTDLVQAALTGYSTDVTALGARSLFHIAALLATRLSPQQSDETLNFGIDLLETSTRDDDGDGPWTPSLQPSDSVINALAGYVWAGLASPRREERWEFSHVIRSWVELDWRDALEALRSYATTGAAAPFVDGRLVFYALHARQWLLIGLARGALERPATLSSWIPYLTNAITESHVLLRAFAAKTLRFLHEAGIPGTPTLDVLDGVNASLLPWAVEHDWQQVDADSDDEHGDSSHDYVFGIDIGPYWFAPLGMVFGVGERAVSRRARKLLPAIFGVLGARAGDDARHKLHIFGSSETHHSHGELPATDELRSYQAYHLLMSVAAQLLDSHAVGKRDDMDVDQFSEWISRFLVARTDGRWCADRRDPYLVPSDPTQKGYVPDWRWQVSPHGIDENARTDDGLRVLWGHWAVESENGRELIRVQSAYVSRGCASALLSALQTSPDLNHAWLPAIDGQGNIDFRQFRISGWVEHESEVRGADADDPWAAGIHDPGPSPGKATINALALTPSADGRCWTASGVLMRSESWAHEVGYGREREQLVGSRLAANAGAVRQLLAAKPDACLILSISVRRRPSRYSQDNDATPAHGAPYVRYYLLDSDDIARTL